ncbi:glycosyl hydrolase family 57 [Oligoflexia bacterium]|nr:glycosyl hydrolase family 57 [Oligoflexia bacterium]
MDTSKSTPTAKLTEYIDEIPHISGSEKEIEDLINSSKGSEIFRPESRFDFSKIQSCCAVALHMHQPMIPAGSSDLHTAKIISNLEYMMQNPNDGDNHNASVFHWCYKRIGDFIPELVQQGKEPRVMLDYSGTLLHGMHQMKLDDVFENLKKITCDPEYRRCVEWLGCPWGHPVAPSTPVQDYRLHVKAWQHHFSSLFGMQALARVRGFSPSEMALPNHPDIAYEFVKILKECGFQWVLVQEHTIENPENGHGPQQKHIPHRLVCRNSAGETASIVVLIKTQGSDTKLVAQMQPYFEAKGLQRFALAGKEIPQIVSQIADGENGGVMMNEFPSKYLEIAGESTGTDTPLINGTEYLEHLFASGIKEEDLPVVQPIMQNRIWERFTPGDGPEKLAAAIEDLKQEDHQFHMDGGSWTNSISWVEGYENVLAPMEKASSVFNEKILKAEVSSGGPRFRTALYYLMLSQTSCYRYWGEGLWADYGREICRRAEEVLGKDY